MVIPWGQAMMTLMACFSAVAEVTTAMTMTTSLPLTGTCAIECAIKRRPSVIVTLSPVKATITISLLWWQPFTRPTICHIETICLLGSWPSLLLAWPMLASRVSPTTPHWCGQVSRTRTALQHSATAAAADKVGWLQDSNEQLYMLVYNVQSMQCACITTAVLHYAPSRCDLDGGLLP